jgi:hypothetical protein
MERVGKERDAKVTCGCAGEACCSRLMQKCNTRHASMSTYKTYSNRYLSSRMFEWEPGRECVASLVELQRHLAELAAHPSGWMAWNHRRIMLRLTGGTATINMLEFQSSKWRRGHGGASTQSRQRQAK